jgi:hypothetical protein
MRTILPAKFGDLAKLSSASDKVPPTSPSLQSRNSSVEEFEGALTKARAAWRASRGPTLTATRSARLRGVHRSFVNNRTSTRRSVCR